MFGLTGRELRFTFIISTAHFAQHYLMRIIPPLIPILSVALVYPLWQLGLLISLYLFGGGLLQAPLGILADRYDRLYILPVGLVISGGAYILFAVAPTLGSTVPAFTILDSTFQGGFILMGLAMLTAGIGSAVVHPTGFPLITANVEPQAKGKVIGAFGSAAKVGDAAGPALVGVLILVFVWEEIVMVLGITGIAIGIGVYLALRGGPYETAPVSQQPADPEAADESTDTNQSGDNRTYRYPLLVMFIFFVTRKFSSDGLLSFVPVFIVGVYGYAFDLFGMSLRAESVANFYFSALLIAAAIAQLLAGGVTDRYDSRVVIIGLFGISTLGLLALAIVDLSPILLLIIMLILGGSFWGTNPARDTLVSDISPAEREGRTFGYIMAATQLTGALFPAIIGYILDSVGLRQGFLILAGGCVLAIVTISLLFLDRIYVSTKQLGGGPTIDSSD